MNKIKYLSIRWSKSFGCESLWCCQSLWWEK